MNFGIFGKKLFCMSLSFVLSGKVSLGGIGPAGNVYKGNGKKSTIGRSTKGDLQRASEKNASKRGKSVQNGNDKLINAKRIAIAGALLVPTAGILSWAYKHFNESKPGGNGGGNPPLPPPGSKQNGSGSGGSTSSLSLTWDFDDVDRNNGDVCRFSPHDQNKTDVNSLADWMGNPYIPKFVEYLNGEFKKAGLNFENLSANGLVSSSRGLSSGHGCQISQVEQITDGAIDKGMQFVKSVSFNELKKCFEANKNGFTGKFGKGSATFELWKGVDALRLYESAADGAIVQIASTSSTMEGGGPVCGWLPGVQGERASLQGVVESKIRESAFIKGRLTGTLDKLFKAIAAKGINVSSIKNDHNLNLRGTNDVNLLAKVYNELNGAILSYSDALEDNLMINSQWILCPNGKKQLQVFSCAPSMRHSGGDDAQKLDKVRGDICKKIVVPQYISIARMAVIRAFRLGKQNQSDPSAPESDPVELHLTRVGQGVFGNPEEIMQEALKEVASIVKGYNIKVVLHGYEDGDCNKWRSEAGKLGIKLEEKR